jgi:hypothetical protein
MAMLKNKRRLIKRVWPSKKGETNICFKSIQPNDSTSTRYCAEPVFMTKWTLSMKWLNAAPQRVAPKAASCRHKSKKIGKGKKLKLRSEIGRLKYTSASFHKPSSYHTIKMVFQFPFLSFPSAFYSWIS